MWGPGLFRAILRRPRLWGEALRAGLAMAPRAWWRSRRPVPLPEPRYASWRRATAYGREDALATADDVIAYLDWRRRYRRSLRQGGVASG